MGEEEMRRGENESEVEGRKEEGSFPNLPSGLGFCIRRRHRCLNDASWLFFEPLFGQ